AGKSLEVEYAREVAPKRSREKIRGALEEALHEEPAPSLTEITRQTRIRYEHPQPPGGCQPLPTDRLENIGSPVAATGGRRREAKPICEQPRIKKVLEVYLASDSPIPPLDHIASSLGYALDRSLWQKCPELCRALSAKIEGQTAIEPALEQTFQESPPLSLRQVAKRLGFSAACVLKAHAPDLY